MILPKAPAAYDLTDQDKLRSALESADKRNLKTGDALKSISFKDSATGKIVVLTVVSGAIVLT